MTSTPRSLKSWVLALGAFIGMGLLGCGPKVISHLQSDASLPSHIALFPADYSVDIPRERIDLVRGELVSGLRNHGFIVAEDKIVKSICSSPDCPERARLSSNYLVDAYATLTITSFSKNNFVAGYYNQLSGTLSFQGKDGSQLMSIDYTESEKGGLLFNSGQVLQGVLSQVHNSGDAAYEELASEFAKSVVDQIPAPIISAHAAQQEGLELTLQSVTAEWRGTKHYTVCAKGTPHSFASLIVGGHQAALREASPGSYCAAFSALVAPATGTPAIVELRSAFGSSERRDVALPARSPCALEERLQRSNDEVSVRCALVGRDLSRVQAGCSDKIKPCKAEKIVLYTASSEAGPFQKWSEVTSASTKLPSSSNVIQVVAVGAGGVPSIPVPIAPNSTQRE